MRDILFKGKRKDTGEWIEGSLIISVNRAWISSEKTDPQRLRSISNTNAIWRSIEIFPATICQYTGLIDKNGNKIWENDIIQYEDITAPVRFGIYDLRYGFYVDFSRETCLREELAYWKSKVIVVGNIFDNPELLSQEGERKWTM